MRLLGCILFVIIILVGCLAVVGTSDADEPAAQGTFEIGTAVTHTIKYTERCPTAQKAIGFYRQKYKTHREKMDATGPVPRVWYPCDAARRRAVEWRDRAALAKVELGKWLDYHYDWRSWLPRNWYLLGSCESGYGGDPRWEHTGRTHHGSFVSAFGISTREYDKDAAHMGAPPWHVRHTPRDQYLAALGHYARFGDGWTCPGP